MREYLIGTGGWAYFHVPRLHPLIAYSRAFNFVEVNSTFYNVPPLEQVERWRKLVPHDFQFAVRAHRELTHGRVFQRTPEAFAAFQKMKQICDALKTNILHLQTPASFELSEAIIDEFNQFVSSLDLGKLRLVLEIRGVRPSKLPIKLSRIMQNYNMIHCVDVSKGEMPAYDSDMLYSRLFGKGKQNVYQPTDEELVEIDNRVSDSGVQKAVMSFHFVRMYKDAARLKIYKQTGKFPRVTGSTGLSSLEEVLSEDSSFPSTKQELMRGQGWKLFELDENKRVHAEELLQQLAKKTYTNISEVIDSLRSTTGRPT